MKKTGWQAGRLAGWQQSVSQDFSTGLNVSLLADCFERCRDNMLRCFTTRSTSYICELSIISSKRTCPAKWIGTYFTGLHDIEVGSYQGGWASADEQA